jgi:hypothetical protein
MIRRYALSEVQEKLAEFPAVGLVGPRQSGKTTLARHLCAQSSQPSTYLDLELPSDVAKLTDPELFLNAHAGELVVLDEVQRRPDLFPVLRALVDRDRRPGRFLLLGSASPDLGRQSSESLAGRIAYVEIGPLTLSESGVSEQAVRSLWLRGGYPLSFLAASDGDSMSWRSAFIATYLERDLPHYGVRVAAPALRRFWLMLAHLHGQTWNASAVASSMGISAFASRHYLDILDDTFVIRQLTPYFANVGKRLTKTPKVYIRDSGLLHALLSIPGYDDLLGHPVAGPSFEGWAIEQILSSVPRSWEHFYYRTSAGAEMDLVLIPPGQPPIAVEMKLSMAPTTSRGFHESFKDLRCRVGYVVYPGNEFYQLREHVHALPVSQCSRIAADYVTSQR